MSEDTEDAAGTSSPMSTEKPSLAGGSDTKHERKGKSSGSKGRGGGGGGRKNKDKILDSTMNAALLPLPKLVPFPDEIAHKNALKECKEMIDKLKQEQHQLYESKQKNLDSNEAVYVERGTAKRHFNEQLSNFKRLNDEKLILQAEFDELLGEIDRIRRRLPPLEKESRDDPLQPIVDKNIKALERRIETETLKLPEEKRILSEIQSLKQSKTIIRQYDKTREEFVAAKAKLTAKRDEVTAAFSRMDQSKKSLDNIKNPTPDKEESDKIRNEGKRINGEINAIYTKMDKLREQYYASKEEAQASEHEYWIVNQENLKIKREIEKKIREDKFKEREEEMKQYHPHEEDLQRCTQLISYLENLLAKHNEHTAKQAAEAGKQDLKIPDDVKLIGKRSKEEEEYFVGGKKNKGPQMSATAKQKQPAVEKAPTSITHTVNVFTEFQLVGIDPPFSYSDIPKIVEEIKKKKEYYQTAPREKPEKEPKESKEKEPKEESESKEQEPGSEKPPKDTEKSAKPAKPAKVEADTSSTTDFPAFPTQSGAPMVTTVNLEWGAGKFKKPAPAPVPVSANPTPKESINPAASSSPTASVSTTATTTTTTATTATTAPSTSTPATTSEKKERYDRKPRRDDRKSNRTDENKTRQKG